MKIPYLLLATTLVLTACGSETETLLSEAKKAVEAETTETSTIAHAPKNIESATTQEVKVQPVAAAEKQIEEKSFELPLGRLTGIIDTGEYKQAIINNQNQIIRLKEGDNWQGWTVTAIHPEKIAINHEGEEHSLLLLSEFRSPQLTQTELDNKANQQEKQQTEAIQKTAQEPNTQAFTEEQLIELRSRLLVGR